MKFEFTIDPNGERRFWKGDSGCATYSVVAPTSVEALLAILHAERDNEAITEVEVKEIDEDRAKATRILGDGGPDITFFDMPMGDVACSEWP